MGRGGEQKGVRMPSPQTTIPSRHFKTPAPARHVQTSVIARGQVGGGGGGRWGGWQVVQEERGGVSMLSSGSTLYH